MRDFRIDLYLNVNFGSYSAYIRIIIAYPTEEIIVSNRSLALFLVTILEGPKLQEDKNKDDNDDVSKQIKKYKETWRRPE